nr:alpha/beta hydrolase [Psychromicrobium sp. YIM S02556]
MGPGYQKQALDLGTDDDGPVTATLVRYRPPAPTLHSGSLHTLHRHLPWSDGFRPGRDEQSQPEAPCVLYLHGWADYFFQTELAETLAEHGVKFYALDLRRYGRSLQPGQEEGYTEDLTVYDADLAAAMAVIRAEEGQSTQIHLLAHSLGGLIATLWAERHPGELTSLILNAPWLELQGSRFVRQVASQLVGPWVRAAPRRIFPLPEMTAYWQSVSITAHGEWDLDPRWRPAASFPIRAGWVKAVLNGHAEVSKGLDIDVPVLMMLSGRSLIQADWSAEMMEVDAVIDVGEMSRIALKLGRRVMVNRYPGALHDVFLSRRDVRELAYRDLHDWLSAYRPRTDVPLLWRIGTDSSGLTHQD